MNLFEKDHILSKYQYYLLKQWFAQRLMFFCNYTIRIQSLRLAMCAMIATHDDDVDDEDDDDLGDDDEDDDDLDDKIPYSLFQI